MITREQVIAEARTWLGTPYEMNQACKGAGADCGRFIYDVLQTCGLIPVEIQAKTIEIFGNNWSSNTGEEKYKNYIFRMLRHARKLTEGVSYPTLRALPGCIALVHTQGARVADHGAIVVAWPKCIHSIPDYGVSEVDASTHWLWGHKKVEIFDPFGDPE